MKAKNSRILPLALAFAALLTRPTVVQAQFYYTVVDNVTVTITGYYGPEGAVTIPSIINGLPVSSIGDASFYKCSTRTSVTIPGSVINIGVGAFWASTSLINITIGNSVTSIGMCTFANCYSLTGVYFNGNAPSLDPCEFDGDNNSTIYYSPVP